MAMRMAGTLLCVMTIACNLAWSEQANCSINLTAEQRRADVALFFDFIRKNYPFVDVIVTEKGLASVLSLELAYSNRAAQAKTNKEFIQIIDEIILRLRQGTRHANIMEAQDLPSNFDTEKHCFYNDITPDSIALHKYWWQELDFQSRFANASLQVHYREGQYVVTQGHHYDNRHIQRGSVIRQVDGIAAIDFVKSQQHLVPLRFDPVLKRPYSYHPSPFYAYGNRSNRHWKVEFEFEGKTINCNVPKRPGYVPPRQYPNPRTNYLCRELTDKVAYLGIFSFPSVSVAKRDLKKIAAFFSKSNYDKLIIDLRGNEGGSVAYGEEVLVRPFLREARKTAQFGAAKKTVYNQIRDKMAIIDRMEQDTVRQYDFRRVDTIPYDQLPDVIKEKNPYDKTLYYIKATRDYEPSQRFNYSGEIVLLIDNDCFSAVENIIRVHKELGLSTIMGTHSGGGAAIAMPPWIFELPNSHILFILEVELTYNADGTVNELYGTAPDIALESSVYPTSFPDSYSRKDLLRDNWISWILRN